MGLEKRELNNVPISNSAVKIKALSLIKPIIPLKLQMVGSIHFENN